MQRDLAHRDPWADSLERSHARRLRNGAAKPFATAEELLPSQPRDLTDPELLKRSEWRALARRAAANDNFEMPRPSPRGLSLAAVFAVAGVPAAGLAGGVTGGIASAAAATHSGVLKKGARGSGVARMQRALGVHADGIFGPGTKRAVKRFQARHGLTVDGIAGPQTLRSLGAGQTHTAALMRSSGPKGTKAIQHALGLHADGILGPQTKRAIRRFQKRHGLTVDGIVGPATRRALAGAGGTRFASFHKSSSSGGGVGALQRKLGVGADGVFGPGTQAALKSFQRRHGLTADGIAGPATRNALGLGSGPVLKRGHRGGGGGGSSTNGVVGRVIAAANRIATTPYVWGGGHGSFAASGYDCSGSVSYALHGGGLLKTPEDSSALESYGSPGPGRHITIYANSGHAFMTINGRRFDTSARSRTGSRWSNEMTSTAGYVVRHPAGY